jgi:hypothetical protein
MISERASPRSQQPATIHYPQDLFCITIFHLCLSFANSHFFLRAFPFTFYEFVIPPLRVTSCDRLIVYNLVSLMSHLKLPTITSLLFPHTN